jgi:hypothetical protein
MDAIDEGDSATLTLSFLDENRVPVPPDSATVKITDEESGNVIRDTEVIAVTDTFYDLEITSEENGLVDPKSSRERRKVFVEWDYMSISGTKHGTDAYFYHINKI